MLELGTPIPPFNLPDLDGQLVSNDLYNNKPMLVMFICNHCPYVKHVISKLSDLVKEYQSKGVSVVGINSNDVENYADDAPDKMKEFAAQHDFSFPYLYDETQSVAKAYRAACTPDFYLFNREHKLVYRGQMDDARPHSDAPITGRDLTAAVDNMLAGKPVFENQLPSMGCNIKWKPGNEPDYFGA
jgi:peroxiredoxin